ncbi:MAG: hypothetical protein OXS32_13025, partial [Verrucomicrobiales bacterium]|nr:hypothetical protein [Verrucomicrobiales bacterium]
MARLFLSLGQALGQVGKKRPSAAGSWDNPQSLAKRENVLVLGNVRIAFLRPGGDAARDALE